MGKRQCTVEGLEMKRTLRNFFHKKTVFVTGHTGFKGGWLTTWLKMLGARVVGYSLPPENEDISFFKTTAVANDMVSIFGDIRSLTDVTDAVQKHKPSIIIHLAAQALVRRSYQHPVDTYSTNVMGTVNVLEAARQSTATRLVLVVTSDKCYENREWCWGYREIDPLGGHDPYSSSKGCAELVSAAYRNSFYQKDKKIRLATARAGNVIGGGDWAADRLVPDIFRSIMSKKPVILRNPQAVRPWQHVLEPVRGYLMLTHNLWTGGDAFADAWNFGPRDQDCLTVHELAQYIADRTGQDNIVLPKKSQAQHEALNLKLDSSKAFSRIGWRPLLSIGEAVEMTVDWYLDFLDGSKNLGEKTIDQIESYMQRQT